MKSYFTSIVNNESGLHPIPVIVGISRAVTKKLARFSLKIIKDSEYCNSQNLQFLHTVKREITFMLDSHKFGSGPITSVYHEN